MDAQNVATAYWIWGADKSVYGPVELPQLVGWIKEERVLSDTWLYSDAQDHWQAAKQYSELQMFFRPRNKQANEPESNSAEGTPPRLKPGSLRRIKLLADLSDLQLEKFAEFLEPLEVRQGTEVTQQGQSGDAMFFVLGGELRVRLMIGGKESVLATLEAGEFFGEMALFDQGPRSADVIANRDSQLLRLSAAHFDKLRTTATDLAAQFVFAVGKSLTARIRADNKRFRDSVQFSRSAHATE